MSTRSQLQFGYKDETGFHSTAQIYHHYDGYPSNRLKDIELAITSAHEAYKRNSGYEYRLSETYPSDLAAFYILAHKTGPGNIEIDQHLHGDIEFLYQIWQDKDYSFHVAIYTTHQPEEEPYNETVWKTFWDDPKIEHMRFVRDGELASLITYYQNNEDD
jgi:hypothetical protein